MAQMKAFDVKIGIRQHPEMVLTALAGLKTAGVSVMQHYQIAVLQLGYGYFAYLVTMNFCTYSRSLNFFAKKPPTLLTFPFRRVE